MMVKSSHNDISELLEPSGTHSVMPASQVCRVSPIPVINLLFPKNRQTYGSVQKQSQAKRVCNPELQVFKHLSKYLTLRQDLCYQCSSLQSTSVKTQGMTQVILRFCKAPSCKHTLYQLFTSPPWSCQKPSISQKAADLCLWFK